MNNDFFATYFVSGPPALSGLPYTQPQPRAGSLNSAPQATTLTGKSAAGADPQPTQDPDVVERLGTLVKSVNVSVSVMVPVISIFNTLYAGYKAREADWARTGYYQDMADTFLPMRAIRAITLFVRLASVITTFAKGERTAPGQDERFIATIFSGLRASVAAVVFFTDPPSGEGKIAHLKGQVSANKDSKMAENFYQATAGVQGVVNLVCYAILYEKEVEATEWQWHNVEISQLGLVNNCFGFGGNMGNRLAYTTIRNSSDPVIIRWTLRAQSVSLRIG